MWITSDGEVTMGKYFEMWLSPLLPLPTFLGKPLQLNFNLEKYKSSESHTVIHQMQYHVTHLIGWFP